MSNDLPRPQDTEDVRLTFSTGDDEFDQGVLNGLLARLKPHYEISYNGEDGYVVEGRADR